MPLTINNQNINISSWITQLLIQELNENNPVTTEIILNYFNNINDTIIDTPLNDTPLNDTPLHDTPLNDTPLHDTPLNDTPIYDTPLNDTPLHDTPIYDTPLNDTPLHDTPIYDTPYGSTGGTPNVELYYTDYSSYNNNSLHTSIIDFPNHIIP